MRLGSRYLLLTLLFSFCAKGAAVIEKPSSVELKIMTQNLYVGADLHGLVARNKIPKSFLKILRFIPKVADSMVKQMLENDFQARAEKFIDDIEKQAPDVICLQEVASWELERTSNFFKTGKLFSSHEVDFLKIFTSTLTARGLEYRIAEVGINADYTIPSDSYGAVRIQDRDVTLIHSSIELLTSRSEKFQDQWTRWFGIKKINLNKGYLFTKLRKTGRDFVVVNTHIENLGNHKYGQNRELLKAFARPELPTFIAGDFNTNPSDRAFHRPWADHYFDSWAQLHGSAAGFTCCFRHPLTIFDSSPSVRYDYVLASKNVKVLHSALIGRYRFNIPNSSGKSAWVSDHLGVFNKYIL